MTMFATGQSRRLLYDGHDWTFDLLEIGLRRDRGDRCRRVGAGPFRQYDRSDHRRTNARFLRIDRYAADVPALVVRQAVRARRGPLSEGRAGAGLRTGHQFGPLHQLHHGRELHDDADTGTRPRSHGAQPLLQEQLLVSRMDATRRHPRLPRLRQVLCHPLRGTVRRRRSRASARCRARFDGAGRQPQSRHQGGADDSHASANAN